MKVSQLAVDSLPWTWVKGWRQPTLVSVTKHKHVSVSNSSDLLDWCKILCNIRSLLKLIRLPNQHSSLPYLGSSQSSFATLGFVSKFEWWPHPLTDDSKCQHVPPLYFFFFSVKVTHLLNFSNESFLGNKVTYQRVIGHMTEPSLTKIDFTGLSH